MSLEGLLKRMNTLLRDNLAERNMAISMLPITHSRIFEQGKDSSGGDIGTYSKSYLKQRRKNNYPNSSKVILQATRQMSNDFSVVLEDNFVGLGFKNQLNADKSAWAEGTYGKDIFSHTKNEVSRSVSLLRKEVNRLISK